MKCRGLKNIQPEQQETRQPDRRHQEVELQVEHTEIQLAVIQEQHRERHQEQVQEQAAEQLVELAAEQLAEQQMERNKPQIKKKG